MQNEKNLEYSRVFCNKRLTEHNSTVRRGAIFIYFTQIKKNVHGDSIETPSYDILVDVQKQRIPPKQNLLRNTLSLITKIYQ